MKKRFLLSFSCVVLVASMFHPSNAEAGPFRGWRSATLASQGSAPHVPGTVARQESRDVPGWQASYRRTSPEGTSPFPWGVGSHFGQQVSR
jgi:hypothetical protein